MASSSSAAARARRETGFALVEVIVSAAVLAIVALAVLSGVDAANGSSAREKARAVAASLAEQDQERMRSMSVESLIAMGANPPATVDGVTYTVQSKAEWVTDDTGGTPSCENSSNQAEYLHITTTVTSAIVGARIKPVKIDSLMAPSVAYSSTHGTLGVRVVDRNNAGVPNIAVNVHSDTFAPPQGVTNQDGCVLFREIPIGSYTIVLDQGGFVDPQGHQHSEATQGVSAGRVNIKTMTYDKATSALVGIVSHKPGSTYAAGPTYTSRHDTIAAMNSGDLSILWQWPPTPSATVFSSITATGLYPYKSSSYQFFTGNCDWQSPVQNGNSTYFNAGGPGASALLLADPTQSQPQSVTVRQPPLSFRVRRNSANTAFTDGAIVVYVYPQMPVGDGCSAGRIQLTTTAWPVAWGAAPNSLTNTHWVTRQVTGGGFDSGVPFGKYSVCLWDTATNKRWTDPSLSVDNTSPNGGPNNVATSPQEFPPSGTSVGWGSTNVTCPA